MTITVVISTWQIPFDQVVRDIRQFDSTEEATTFINACSKQWWDACEGDRCVVEFPDEVEAYEPITELGYDHARYEICGEKGFQAMLDGESAAALHEAYYKKKYDDQGLARPGYLINCYVAEGPDGEHVGSEAKHEEYLRQQTAGMAAIEAAYRKPKH